MTDGLFSCIEDPYFSPSNIEFIHEQLVYILCVDISRKSIKMVMVHIRDGQHRFAPLEVINFYTVDYIVNNYINEMRAIQNSRILRTQYVSSQAIINPVNGLGADFNKVKLANRLGQCKVGGTLNFHFN